MSITEAPAPVAQQSEFITVHGGHGVTRRIDTPSIPLDVVTETLAKLRVHTTPVFLPGDVAFVDNEPQYTPPVEIPGYKAIRSDSTGRVLSIPTTQYEVHQYDDSIGDIVRAVLQVADGGAQVHALGYQGWGARAYTQIGLTEPVRFGGDEVYPMLFVASSMDQTLATQGRFGGNRLVCSNMVSGISKRWTEVWKVKHTSQSAARLAEAAELVQGLIAAGAELEADIRTLVDAKLNDRQFRALLDQADPKPVPVEGAEDASGFRSKLTRWENRREGLVRMWTEDDRVAPWAGTAWGAVQMFNTWHQHSAPARSNRSRTDRAVNRFISGTTTVADRRIATMALDASHN